MASEVEVKSQQEKGPSLPPLVKIQESFKLIIPDEVERKIRHLCTKIPTVEWSGTLFYDYKGNWEEGTLEVTCRDIYVMDIGSAGYTEFDVNPGVVSYMCDHMELMDCQMGLIHSHNRMSTFFSGTDTATLREEGSKRNHFVSLIVNNAGTYTAGITRQIKSAREVRDIYTYGTFNNETVNGERAYSVEETEIEWTNLEICKPRGYSFQEIDTRLDEIRKEKAAVVKTPAPATPYTPHKYPVTSYYNASQTALKDINRETVKQPTLFDNEFDTDYMDSEPPFKVPVNLTLPQKMVRSLLLQVLTGSIAIADESKIDVRRWAAGMEKVFDRRFEGNLKYYQAWAESFCEFLVFYPPKQYETEDEMEYAEVVAISLISELEHLPENKYIKILKDVLTAWIAN